MRESPGRGRSLPTLEGIGAPGLGTGKDQGTQGGRRLGAYRRARTDQAARVERPRPKSAHGRAGGPTYWALRLLVVVSMVAGLVAEGVTGVTPASASSVPLWSQVTGAGGPAALSGAAMAYDPGTGQTIMFGGNASGTAQGITWNWNGSTSTWAQLTPLSSPSARYGASLAYDTTTSQLLLFGGYNGTTYMNDTWAWTGTTWEQLSPTASPTGRYGASLAFDGSSGQMVLFGGRTGAVTYGSDTWTFSGSNWTQLTPAASPPQRYEAAFAYDTATSQMVLFGGNGGSALGDTWLWTGTNWTSPGPSTSPTPRYGETLAYSPAIDELVLLGGQTTGGYDNSTWVWNSAGTNWAQLASSTSPSVRTTPAMAFDQSSGQMVVFGGYNGTSYLGDTWQWSATGVTGVSPSSGPLAGTTSVTITGMGFNGVTGTAGVMFGATDATSYHVNNSSSITAVAPAGAAGADNITVTNAAGTSLALAADLFTYQAAPTVTVVSPAAGVVAGGTAVTITGTNFAGATAVDFGTEAAFPSYTVVNPTTITAFSPAELAGVSVDVTVTTPTGTSTTSAADTFTYNPVPVITGLSPSAGSIAGGTPQTPVTITGTGFTGAAAPMFGAVQATNYTVNGSTSISVVAPAQAAGVVAVSVTVPGGTSASSPADLFTYETGPTVSLVNPITSLLAGGGTVTITGTNFTGTPATGAVMFGTTAAIYQVNSATSITATVPAEAGGTVNVTVTTPAGTSTSSAANQFSYYSVPSWSQAQPASSPPAGQGAAEAYDQATGQTILFGGYNGTSYSQATWGWTGANWTELSPTAPAALEQASMAYDPLSGQLLLFGGINGSGDQNETWAWNAGSSTWVAQTVASPPAARNGASMAYDPATSQLLLFGGANGSTFYGDTWKWTGTAWALPTSSGPSARYFAALAYDPGTVQMVLTGGYGTAGGYGSDTWTWNGSAWAQQSPVTSPAPRNGASMAYDIATGQLLLYGGNNGATEYGDTWYWTGATWVQLLAPAGPPPGRTLGVTAYDQATSQMVLFGGIGTGGYVGDTWLIGAPTVTAVAPSSGLPAGGTSVTLTGTNFTGATAVDFGTNAVIPTSTTSTQITVTAPAGGAGVVDVTVTTPDGTSATSALDEFTYQPAPTITVVNPPGGLPAGGTAVTITGTNFAPNTLVDFGTAVAYSVYVSSTEIIAVSPIVPAGTVDITATTGSGTSPTSALDQFTFEGAPTVTNVSPPTGSPGGGTWVTITGTGFIAASAVSFGSTAAARYNWISATQITAETLPESAGTVDVVVTTPAGISPTNPLDRFIFETAPTVTNVTPSSGQAGVATSVVITGTGLSGALDEANPVQFGTTAAAKYTVNSSTQITALSPLSAAGTVDVTVTTPTGTSASNAGDQYSFEGLPTVSQVNPSGGLPAGGIPVIITGNYFGGATAVWFGTTPAGTFTINSVSQITVTKNPTETAGTVDVTVTTPSGTSASNPLDSFTYAGAPTVTNVSPASGDTTGGTSVVISGTNFVGATSVNFGPTADTGITVNSGTSITVLMTPAEAPGTVDVTVVTPSGTSATSSLDQFVYKALPTVSLVTPGAGLPAGTNSVTVTGSGFTGPGFTTPGVMFGAVAGTGVQVLSFNSLTVTVPAEAAGTVNVTVTTPVGTSAVSAADQYIYEAAPTVTAVNPVAGPLAGGTSVTLTGTNFSAATTVNFGATTGTITLVTPTSITVTSPPETAGTVNVTVVTPSGTSATSGSDSFTYEGAPTITAAINPVAGPAGGGTSVTITGTGFIGAGTVKFGTTPGTSPIVNSYSSITITSPAGTAGTVDVTVITPFGTSAVVPADQFTYEATPTVSAVNPLAGPLTGNAPVTITGTNLNGASTVKFGTVAGTGLQVNSPTSITITPPNEAAATVDVTVTTPLGTSTTSAADHFTYEAAPTVTLVSPATGPTTGGASVTITGTNFTGASVVNFGPIAITNTSFNFSSPTSITLAIAPAEAAGTVDVTVTTPAGTSATGAADHYLYAVFPVVTLVNPPAGVPAGGATVTITGTALTGATVKFGTVAGTVTANTATSITVTSPAEAAGTVDVTVATAAGTSATSPADQFLYEPAPTVTNVTPQAGLPAGGTSVTLTGTTFTGATTVKFGTIAGVITNVTATSITVTSPPEAAGTFDVTVTTPAATSATSGADRFSFAPVPTVTTVLPVAGLPGGSTSVTITGSGFIVGVPTTVMFGPTAGTGALVLSTTSMTVNDPAEAAGSVDVTVTTPVGTSATNPGDQFTYEAVPTVTLVSPAGGPTAGLTAVTLSGTNFTDATGVKFGTIAGTGLHINSPTSITITSPAQAAGAETVTVTTPSGTSTTTPTFTYEAGPTVTAVTPLSARRQGARRSPLRAPISVASPASTSGRRRGSTLSSCRRPR